MRPTKHNWYHAQARAVAQRSTCPRLKVGAVLVRDDVIYGQGYNGKARGEEHCTHALDEPCMSSVHAEVNLIASAARLANRVGGASVYVTHAPCLQCARVMINAGVSLVSYAQAYRDGAGVELLASRGLLLNW